MMGGKEEDERGKGEKWEVKKGWWEEQKQRGKNVGKLIRG